MGRINDECSLVVARDKARDGRLALLYHQAVAAVVSKDAARDFNLQLKELSDGKA